MSVTLLAPKIFMNDLTLQVSSYLKVVSQRYHHANYLAESTITTRAVILKLR